MTRGEKRKAVRRLVAAEAQPATELARRIWGLAELPFGEHGSSRLLGRYLAERGFRVDRPLAALPTALRARRGSGRPVVGILAEYDALPECGLRPGRPGHGCGHNLLGAGAAAGAVAAVRLLEERGRRGTVVVWGCPAEEALAGKVYMARDGAFRGLDACLAWHPGAVTLSHGAGGSALDSLLFEFRGRTAHGAYAEAGRSALDAAILTDVAANYLREHVPSNVRIHSVIRDGGRAPNVVPAYARIWYYVRGRDREQVEEIARRLANCARGAALATETRLKTTRLTGVYSRLASEPMGELVRDNLVLLGPGRPTAADRRAARRLVRRKVEFDPRVRSAPVTVQETASSDQDNVSRLAPLGVATVACWPKGIRGHHREVTLFSNQPFAFRGMLRAAELLAACVWDLAADRRLLVRVRREFRRSTRGFRYDPLVPAGQQPQVELYVPGAAQPAARPVAKAMSRL